MEVQKPIISVTLPNVTTNPDCQAEAKKENDAFRLSLVELFDNLKSKNFTEVCQSIYSRDVLSFARNDIGVLTIAELICQYLYRPLNFITFEQCLNSIKHYVIFREKAVQ